MAAGSLALWVGFSAAGVWTTLAAVSVFALTYSLRERHLHAVSCAEMNDRLSSCMPAPPDVAAIARALADSVAVDLLAVVIDDELIGADNAAWWPRSERCGYVVIGSELASDPDIARPALAHELGHGALRHRPPVAPGFGAALAATAALVAVLSMTSLPAIVFALFSVLVTSSAAAAALSHRHEHDADVVAVELVGFDTYAALLASLPCSASDATHPSPGVRLAKLVSAPPAVLRSHRNTAAAARALRVTPSSVGTN